MWNMNEVKTINYVRDYVYHVVFDDGIEGDVDFEDYLKGGPMFVPLADLDFFRKATVEGGTISWSNGADIAPERLYETLAATQTVVH